MNVGQKNARSVREKAIPLLLILPHLLSSSVKTDRFSRCLNGVILCILNYVILYYIQTHTIIKPCPRVCLTTPTF